MSLSVLSFFVNGKLKSVSQPDPRMTLLSYLRSQGLTGTKLGCGEGGCGACTVMLSYYLDGNITHYSANACLTPLCSLDGFAVTTVEGIGGMTQGLHPVQSRIATLHGSQCGFCTPGIVMSLYSTLRSNPNATPHEIEESLDGNLCRCTGYRPILDAAKSLSNSKGGCCGGGGEGGGCPCREGSGVDEGVIGKDAGRVKVHQTTEGVVSSLPSLNEINSSNGVGLSEPIFPPMLTHYQPKSLCFTHTYNHTTAEGECTTSSPHSHTHMWFQPTTLEELLELKATYPQARLICGNTEVGIETKFKGFDYNVLLNPTRISALKSTSLEILNGKRGIRVGAAVTVNGLRDLTKPNHSNSSSATTIKSTLLADVSEEEKRGLVAIHHMLTWFASNQIRNVAVIGGNIATASPISDLNPMLMACGATLRLASKGADGKANFRNVEMKDFFLAYRKVDLKDNEILDSVFIPFTSKFEFVLPFKQARRREDDISIVTAGIRICLDIVPSGTKETKWVISDCCMSWGGMAPVTRLTNATAKSLIGKDWTAAAWEDASKDVMKELELPETVPGGQAEYRMALAGSFVFKTFLIITNELTNLIATNGNEIFPAIPLMDAREKSAIENFVTKEKSESRGEQSYAVHKGVAATANDTLQSVGSNVMHKSGKAQVTGEAIYVDDIPLHSNAVHAALVMSTRAHARIVSVDTSAAEACEGFVAYFSSKDVTGSNAIGAVVKDEEVFATEYVKHYGAVIGVVLAETHEQAVAASKKIVVVYEDLPAIISMEDAIAANSFYPINHEIADGNLEEKVQESEVIVEGTAKLGGQEHFYLETNCTVVFPQEGGGLEIYSSTQNPTKTQNFCASVCGLPASHVVSKCKRMGGGFGGKETRSVFIACTAALSAHLLKRPVAINIERDVDMSITGQRHAFMVKYRAGATKEGKFKFLDLLLYSNGGFSMDLSQPVFDRALFHCDNCYKWPALRARGNVCQTNQPSHTAFRGFGGPQGMMCTEVVLDHLAIALGMTTTSLRECNLYVENDTTHFGQKLVDFYVPSLWQDCKNKSKMDERVIEVEDFNRNNKYRKRGITMLPTKFGINFTAKFMNQGGALVHVYTDGTVLVAHGGTEMGQGLHTKMIQIAAQSFGIPHDLVHIAETSTNTVANSSPTAASMSTDLYGLAVLDACEQILARLKPLKETMPTGYTWKELIYSAFFARIDLSAHGYYAVDSDRCGYDWDKVLQPGQSNAERGNPFNYFTQGIACVEVEIDTLAGDSIVRRVDIVMDVGQSINPALDVGQIEGAFVQGCGWSTMEELVWGDNAHKWVRTGQLFTRGPGTYKIPSFNDAPLDFRVHLSDTHNKFAIHSSKAVGEPPLFLGGCVYFALLEAVRAARKEFLGVADLDSFYRVDHPATSERIRMGCVDKITQSINVPTTFQPKGSW